MTQPLILQAFEGTNKTVPVWFMRQAGRYLPGYQKFKAKYTLDQMFGTPDLAADITCMPVEILNVDAAILFADILTLPQQMGFTISFSKEGPVIENPIQSEKSLKGLKDFEHSESLTQTIRLSVQRLPPDIPLIGFAGSPFTVLCYLIEGGSFVGFQKTFRLLNQQPQLVLKILQILTQNTIRYLQAQKQAGVRLFQLFDTWGGILRPADYAHFVLPFVQQIFKAVDLPSIYYLKGAHHLLKLMKKSGADFLSVCHTVILGKEPVLENIQQGIQGNLFNGLLYADPKILQKEVRDVLLGGQSYKKYIFNLSHGVFPDTTVDQLQRIVDWVHNFEWKGAA